MSLAERKFIKVFQDDAVLRTFTGVTHTSERVLRYMNVSLSREGLSVIKFTVLYLLATNGGTMIPTKIAERTRRTCHNITQLVDRMELQGLVTAKRSEEDRRFVHVTITDKGDKLLYKAILIAREVAKQVMMSISKEDAANCDKLSEIMKKNADQGLDRINRRS